MCERMGESGWLVVPSSTLPIDEGGRRSKVKVKEAKQRMIRSTTAMNYIYSTHTCMIAASDGGQATSSIMNKRESVPGHCSGQAINCPLTPTLAKNGIICPSGWSSG